MRPGDVWHSLLIAYGNLSTQFSTALENAYRVSLAEFEALLWIDRAGGTPIQAIDLVDRLLLTQSGVTRLLGRLESAGFIDRVPCSYDGRRKDISLTEHGRETFAAMKELHAAHIESLITARLTDRQMDELTELLMLLAPKERLV
ncbi:MarR family winged helix-turn-helix transcriptional regulator [Gordonia rhizosphera]|uniref:Putative MarR family transcriptional regulator n=1 Tax=Gordonia rhizosphera NBRC 16068 TaxID=1108045 RepID=K6VB11_9ACTN|nr:MarR family transcriptional regulator [Gordonia rhizosphera]GAB93383.1 putative MarR family transcriptional regulator [Gordonia rhizosphera NBRC 16068]